jgi:hypothetical protein
MSALLEATFRNVPRSRRDRSKSTTWSQGQPGPRATPVGGGIEKALVHVDPPFVDRKTAALPFAVHELLNPVITISFGFAPLMARLGSLSEYASKFLRFGSVFDTTVSTST